MDLNDLGTGVYTARTPCTLLLVPYWDYVNLVRLGGGRCSTLIAYFYWAPIT